MRNFLSSTWDFFFSSTSLYGFVDCKSCENTFFPPPNKYCGGKMKRGGIVGCDSLVVTSATVIICVASLGQSRGKSGRWPRLWEPWNKWINEKGHLAATLCSDKAVVHISCVFIACVLFAVLLASDCKHIPAVCIRAPRQSGGDVRVLPLHQEIWGLYSGNLGILLLLDESGYITQRCLEQPHQLRTCMLVSFICKTKTKFISGLSEAHGWE